MDDNKLDGNAAGGILQEIFPFEMTTAEGTCASCDSTNPIGVLNVYMSAIGTVIRCPSCDNVLIRIVKTKQQYWLDMQGVRALQIAADL